MLTLSPEVQALLAGTAGKKFILTKCEARAFETRPWLDVLKDLPPESFHPREIERLVQQPHGKVEIEWKIEGSKPKFHRFVSFEAAPDFSEIHFVDTLFRSSYRAA